MAETDFESWLQVLAEGGWAIATVAFLFSGALILSRQPRNVVGWLLMTPGAILPLADVATRWLVSLREPPQEMGAGLWLALSLSSWSWVLLIFPVFHLMLTFPDGRLLSPGWRWAVALEAAMVGTMVALASFGSVLELVVDETTLWSVSNPIGFIPVPDYEGGFGVAWNAALVLLAGVSLAAVVRRYTTGSAMQRQQIKWVMAALTVFGLIFGVSAATLRAVPAGLVDLVFGLALMGIPVAVAIAVTRYRLYEIDRLVSRTMTYAIVVALLGATFFGVVGLFSLAMPADSDMAIAASTLVVASLINPLRGRVQDLVDRRFNRRRFDYQQVAELFSERLRTHLEITQVVDEWLGVVGRTLEPASMGLWLKGVGEHDPR